jgi:hypothetical protein
MILNASNPVVFKQGAEYYRMKRIKSIQFNQERLSFDASVLGREQYNVSILFNRDGTMSRAVCSCPDFEEDRMLCGHIVSVLFLIREKDEQGFFSELRFRQAARQIFGFFQDIPNILKKRLELETTFEFNSSGILSSGAYSALSFRIGEDRLYVLKNIKGFFESMEENNEVRLGKNFTYDPACHDFKDEDRPVINFVKELYEAEKLAGRFTGGYSHGTVFRNRIVCLPSSGVKRFFEIVGDKPFRAQIQGKLYENMTVLNSDFPVEFHLAKDGKDLVLSIDFEGSIMPLTDDGEYFLAGDRIYKTTKKQQENFKPFYMAMMYIKGRKLRFLEEDRDKFVSEVFPFANKVGKVIIDENVQSLIEKCDLDAEIYLDRDGVTITADIRFKYKDRAINPFSPVEKQHTSEKILIRDVENERIILDILGEAEFKVRNNQIYLDDEDKIFDLVNDILPRLQEYASIYYSESFKNVVIRHMPSFSGSIGFNTGNDMLEFSFDIDGIAHEELEEVLLSLKDRKKFFRLKDGSYLPLNTKQFKELSDIVDCLDAGLGDFRQGVLQIPKFRSLYLNSYLKESGIYYIERNQAFKEFVQNILEPSDMNFKVPGELKGILRDYQKLGFKWLKTLSVYGLGGILADDMGLGKTLQVLALILSDMQEKGRQPSLVIVPTSLIFNWCAEVEKFAPGLKVIAVTGSRVERSALRENISEADLVITSYPLIRRDIEEYKSINFRYCILDEAQHIKNPGSQNASSVKEINSGVRFALTGTPIENSLSELWSIFDFVIPGYLYSYQKFARKYEAPISNGEGEKQLKELGRQVKPFILRRLKTDVLRELPEKIETRLIVC